MRALCNRAPQGCHVGVAQRLQEYERCVSACPSVWFAPATRGTVSSVRQPTDGPINSNRHTDYVLHMAEERGIRFIRLWFTDVQGFLKSVAINPTELDTALREGMTFDGSAINGYARIQEADMVARPDPSTFRVLPWRREQTVAACSATSNRQMGHHSKETRATS